MPRLKPAEPLPPVPVDEIAADEFCFVRFFWEYVYANRPLIIKGGVKHWPAVDKWKREYFEQWAHHVIRVAPIPADGVNVRIEPASEWNIPNVPTPSGDEDLDDDMVVQEEKGQVRKDRVAVFSAKRIEMTLGDFLERLSTRKPDQPVFYADGDLRSGALKHDFPFVVDDIKPLTVNTAAHAPMSVIVQNILEHMEPKAQHLWLGTESLSKMHFDAVDNFFAQVVGTKKFILIEPKQTNRMVDGRLHKAYYSYDHQTGSFERDQERGVVSSELLTNYLPFDINKPDRNICPLFHHIPKCEAVVEPGDLFYQPYGWWHEVIGTPCPERGLCASISHFMAPYYARGPDAKLRGLPWPIKRNAVYTPLTEKKLEIEAARCIQHTYRKHLARSQPPPPNPTEKSMTELQQEVTQAIDVLNGQNKSTAETSAHSSGLKLKLTYFDARGRAELIRLTLAAAGYQYDDERLTFNEFMQMKQEGSLKFGQLPVLTVNGKQYGQSYSIAKYIARMSGLLPQNLEQSLEAEQYVDATDDIRSKIVPIRYMHGFDAVGGGSPEQDQAKVEAYEKFYSSLLPPMLLNLERSIQSSGFLVGNEMSLADIALYNLVYSLLRANCVVMGQSDEVMKLAQNCLEQSPKIKAHLTLVQNVPRIAAWVQERPATSL